MNNQKDTIEQGGLRLVPEPSDLLHLPRVEKQFVNFMFLRVAPEWRRLDRTAKARIKNEFVSVFEEFRADLLLFTYSLVGFDSKADLMFWRIGPSLDLIQDMTAKLYRTELGSYCETADNYLSITKKRMFVSGGDEDKFHVIAGQKKYFFLYPCSKNREWLEKSTDERDILTEDNFMVGKKFQNIKIHMTHAFGFSDQEYLISFETDEPRDFLAFSEELRESPNAGFSLHGMPVYTCRQRSLTECLDSLG